MNNKWVLYEKNDYIKINDQLDMHFSRLINVAKNKINEGVDPVFEGRNVRKEMEYFMDSIEGYGASDTEPRVVLVTSICDELDLPVEQETIDKLQ